MKCLSLIVISLLYNNVAYAYLDPGSGSIMLQAMIATYAVAGGIISAYWTKFISLFKSVLPLKSTMSKNNFIPKRIESSFRDPSGYVYQLEDKIYRTVRATAAQDYITLREAGIYQKLIQSEKLVFSKEVPLVEDFQSFDSEVKYVIEHKKLPLITYPYEWPFNALKAAALFHLELQLAVLDLNVTLSDASAYNIQFIGTKPIFIDFLSFRSYREGEYWLSHKQFSEHFLFPLLIQASRGITYHAWLRGRGDGISLEEVVSVLPFRSKLKPQVIMHLLLPWIFNKRAKKRAECRGTARVTYPSLPKQSYKHLLVQLHRWICSLAVSKDKRTTWDNYTRLSSYASAESEAKWDFVNRFVQAVQPKVLLDLGCNRGEFSEFALANGARSVVGIDSDPQACDAAFVRAYAKQLPFNVLQVDMTNPSPAQGWRGKEMQALNTRLQADSMIALAVLHHFVVGKNIALGSAVDYLIALAPQGIIEFVDKTDEQVIKMLQFREDIFSDYSRDNFLAAIKICAHIVEIKEIKESRILVWYKKERNMLMKNRHLNMLLSAFTLTFIIFVLGAALVALPVFPKLGSRGYWVTLLFGLGLSSVIAFGLTGVVALIPKRFAPWIILCLQVLCIVAFVVTVFFPRGIALLDGRPLFTSPEGIWAGYGILTALLMGLGYRYATVFKRAFNIVVIMSVGTVSYVFYRAGLLDAVEREAFGKQAIPIEALYEFGSQNNVIVILMDMLQGSFVEQALLRDLDTKNKYSDFNVYTRAISTFPFTNYSLPNILSGQTYASHDNPKFLPNMLAAVNDSFITDAQNHGYQTIGVQSYPELPAAKQNIEAFHVYSDPSKKPLSYFEYILKHNSVNLSCGSAMRVFKTNICKYFGHEEELDKLKESSKNILMQWAARGYVGQEREKLFFVHNFLTHAPIVYNKSGQRYVDIGQYPWTHENLLDEINYSLDLLNNVFERMKSLEIYNDALIVIIGDHGHFMGYHTPDVYTNVEDFEGYKTGANFRPATMYNPVIMIKPPHAKSGCISHAPIGLVDIRSIVNAYLKTEQVNLDSVLAEQRKRMPKIPVMTCLKEDDPYFSTKCHEFVYARENVSSLPALFAGLSQ